MGVWVVRRCTNVGRPTPSRSHHSSTTFVDPGWALPLSTKIEEPNTAHDEQDLCNGACTAMHSAGEKDRGLACGRCKASKLPATKSSTSWLHSLQRKSTLLTLAKDAATSTRRANRPCVSCAAVLGARMRDQQQEIRRRKGGGRLRGEWWEMFSSREESQQQQHTACPFRWQGRDQCFHEQQWVRTSLDCSHDMHGRTRETGAVRLFEPGVECQKHESRGHRV